MGDTCDPVVPFTLLGLLLWGDGRPAALSPSTCPAAAASPDFFQQYAARGTNALLWASLISVTLLLLRKLARLGRLWALGARIPGPPASSFFADSKMVVGYASRGDFTGYLSKLHEKYGPIVKLWLSPTQLLVSVKDAALITEVLVKAKDKVPLTGRAFTLAFGKSSIFVSSFSKVQKMRESLALQLNGRLLERLNTVPLKVVERVIGSVDFDAVKGVLDCRSVSQQLAFYMLGSTLFGDAFLVWSDATVYEELLVAVAKNAFFWASWSIPPFWRRGFWRYQSLCTKLKRLTQDIVKDCRRERHSLDLNDWDSYEAFLVQEEVEGGLDLDDEQCGNMMGMMFHGYLKAANLIASVLTRLALYPEIQEKIYSEIIMVKNKSRNPGLCDVEKMQFLLATIYESARLLPADPLLQRCSLNHDLSLKSSLTVPAGAIIVVPLQLVQMDNSIWGKDASQFNPHRFLVNAGHHGDNAAELKTDTVPMNPYTGMIEEHENFMGGPSMFSELNNSAVFLPFGSGTRICIGQKFAILGILKLFASLLIKYEARVQSGFENGMKPIMDDHTLQLPNLKIMFVKREH